MTTILLPPEIETPLTAEARRRGVTLERLVLDAFKVPKRSSLMRYRLLVNFFL